MKKGIVMLTTVLILMFGTIGCEQSLRFAASQNIKQSAELTNDLARKIYAEGTNSQSPASRQLVQGTQVSLSYIGRPKEPADPEQFETITQHAQVEAEQRPDTFALINSTLDFVIALGILLPTGGVAGVGVSKVIKFAKTAKEKSTALRQIIQGNELFKKDATPEVKKAFAEAQDVKQTSNGTKLIIAETKLT